MKTTLIDKTERYRYETLEGTGVGMQEFQTGNEVRSLFLHRGGQVDLDVTHDGKVHHYALRAGNGFIAGPNISYKLRSINPFLAIQSSSEAREGPIIQIVDTGDKKTEEELNGYKIVVDPKRVSKPWGHELWISWFRDYHVLKQIGMNAGNLSSLQLHEHKLETNYLVEGQADVIDGYPVDVTWTEEQMKEAVKDVNWADYTERKGPGMLWTNQPGIVHRVISVEDYIAYETSTPELDDVIRLSDTTGRSSGRIDEEHK